MEASELIERALVEAFTFQVPDSGYVEGGQFWIAGGITPQTSGCLVNLNEVAADIARALQHQGEAERG